MEATAAIWKNDFPVKTWCVCPSNLITRRYVYTDPQLNTLRAPEVLLCHYALFMASQLHGDKSVVGMIVRRYEKVGQ